MIRLRIGKVCRSGSISIENSDTTAPFPLQIFSASASFSGGYNFDNPEPMTAIVRPFAASAPWCAAVSIPRASPLITVNPA
jgi:hypothetical protein